MSQGADTGPDDRPITVVVGYVPTQTGVLAIKEAAREARARDAEVIVVNVVGQAGYVVPTAAEEKTLEAVSARLTANGVRNSVRQVNADTPAAEIILEIAREVDASLIVLGMHQRSWLAKRALGSTVRSVAMAAPCSLLVVPDVDDRAKPRLANEPPPLRSLGQE
jgi:nucleotide-binding universal stress UspA family protein